MAEAQRLGRDVFMALAAVGWADGKLDSDEADAIVRAALEEGLDIDEITEIEEATKKPLDIGMIDLTNMTKADRLFVYAVASWIARVDGELDQKEQKALDKLGAVLRIPARPREHADRIVVEVGELGESDKPVFYNLPKLRKTLKARLVQAQALREQEKAARAGGAGRDGRKPKSKK